MQKEYKTRHDWVGKVIHWDLCKKLKFDHTTKWYIHKPESVLENKLHKIWDTNGSSNPSKRPDLPIFNKNENLLYSGFCCPSRQQSENQRRWKERLVLRPCQRTKKAVKHEGDSDTKCNWTAWNRPQRLGKGTGRVGNQKTNRDHSNYCIAEISHNTEKSPRGLRRLASEIQSIKAGVKNLKGE